MILKQVDFVDVKVATVGTGEQAGFERLFAAGQGALDVERADHPIFGRTKRQVDHWRRTFDDAVRSDFGPIGAFRRGSRVHRTPFDLSDLWQKRRKRADRG